MVFCVLPVLPAFAQVMPTPRLQVLLPNGGELLQSGREYLITWTGVDSTLRIRLEYSTNAGRSWKFITDTATGGQYLWKPIPNTPSDSCLIQATGTAGDSTIPVGRTLVQFQVPRTEQPSNPRWFGGYVGTQSTAFSPDGTKILVTYSSELVESSAYFYGWKQQNTEVRDGRTGAVLYTLQPYISASVNTSRPYGWWGYGYGYGNGWGGNKQSRWHPDNTRFISQLTDTTIGIFDTQMGTLIRTVAIPTRGDVTRISDMQWTGAGQEILVTIQHTFYNLSYTNGSYDTLRTVMARFDANTGMPSNTPIMLGQYVWNSNITNRCNSYWYGGWGGGGNVSHDGERILAEVIDSITCAFRGYAIRSTRTYAILQTLPQSVIYLYSGAWNWGGNNVWSPNDSLIMMNEGFDQNTKSYPILFISSHTGQIVQRVNAPNLRNTGGYGYNASWSPDSRRYLIDNYLLSNFIAPTRVVVNVEAGTIEPTIRNIQSVWGSGYGYGYYGWGNGAWGGGGNGKNASSTTWSPDSRFIAGFLYQNRNSQTNNISLGYNYTNNNTNTVGIWNARTGCLLQTFRLPFPDDTDSPERRTFLYTPLQWSPDGKRLLLFSPTKISDRREVRNQPNVFAYNRADYDGTALIANVNVEEIVCQEDVSDSLWTILPRGALKVENVAFSTLQCGATSQTISFLAANFSTKRLTLLIPTISGANASDFILVTSSNVRLVPTTSGTIPAVSIGESGGRADFTVLFAPLGLGARSAIMTFRDTSGTELESITLTGRKDTFAIAPADLRVNIGRVLQFQSTRASVSFRNVGTATLLWDTRSFGSGMGGAGGGANTGALAGIIPQTFQTAAGRFVVDSIAPSRIEPNDSGRVYVSYVRSDSIGKYSDSVDILNCASARHQLIVSAEVVPNEPRLEVDSVLSFGHLICEASSIATLTLRNTGGKQLAIITAPIVDDVQFKSQIEVRELRIQPFDSLTLPIRFTPSAGGAVSSVIFINSDDRRRIRTLVRLVGRKTLYQYAWSPETVNFGNVPFGKSQTRTVSLTNQGTEPYLWQSLPTNLDPNFVLESVAPNPVPTGTTATATVRFLGLRQTGQVRVTPSIPMNDVCNTQTALTLAARVLDPQPQIVIQDTTRLLPLYCQSSTRGTILITNNGDAELRIDSYAVEGAQALEFPKDSITLGATTLKQMESTTLRFLFQPRDTGTRTATLFLKTNDTATARNGEIRVALVGRKDSVNFIAARLPKSSSAPLSTVEEFTPLFDTVIVRNTGTVPLGWAYFIGTSLERQQTFPIRIDTTFVVDSIVPLITPRGGESRLFVRFLGGPAGLDARGKNFTLQATSMLTASCDRAYTFSLNGVVPKQPRLAPIQGASARLLCENSTTFTIRLASIGTDDVAFFEPIVFTENPNNIFSINYSPRRIPERTGRDSIVISAQTAQTGTFTGILRIRSNAANLPDTSVSITLRKDSSGVRAVPTSVDFAALGENIPASRTIAIVNTGTIPQGFALPLRAGAFTLDSLGQNPIPANSQTQARVRFLGGTGGVVRDTIRFVDSCGRVMVLPLAARVIAGLAALPDEVAIQINDVEEVPVFLLNRKGVEAGMEATFRLKVANTSLLDVVSPKPQMSFFDKTVSPVPQILKFNAVIPASGESEPLLRLHVRSLLGNATTTTILLDSVFVSGVQVQSLGTTLYRSRGVNYAGGAPRLIYTPYLTALAIAPNPIGEQVTLSLTARESMPLVVEMTDILGKRHTLYEGRLEAGSGAVEIPTRGIPSGVYLLVVRMGNESVSRMVTVVR